MKPVLKIVSYLLIFSLAFHFVLTTFLFLSKTDSPAVLSLISVLPVSKPVTVISQVGENHLTIEGYTSPGALVELSTGLFTVTEKTRASQTGHFIFRNILLHPYLSKEPCLIATDENQAATTPPLCLAQLPRDHDLYITDVVLAPTLLIGQDHAQSGETVLAKGYTIPNAQVDLYLFRQERKWFWTSWVRKAQASGTPRFDFKSDKNGYFEFNLPSYLPTIYRLFVASQFHNAPSPKSNTLKFQVLDFWQNILLTIYNLLYLLWSILILFLKNPFFIYFLEIAIIFLLFFLLKRKKKNLALMRLPPRKLLIKND